MTARCPLRENGVLLAALSPLTDWLECHGFQAPSQALSATTGGTSALLIAHACDYIRRRDHADPSQKEELGLAALACLDAALRRIKSSSRTQLVRLDGRGSSRVTSLGELYMTRASQAGLPVLLLVELLRGDTPDVGAMRRLSSLCEKIYFADEDGHALPQIGAPTPLPTARKPRRLLNIYCGRPLLEHLCEARNDPPLQIRAFEERLSSDLLERTAALERKIASCLGRSHDLPDESEVKLRSRLEALLRAAGVSWQKRFGREVQTILHELHADERRPFVDPSARNIVLDSTRDEYLQGKTRVSYIDFNRWLFMGSAAHTAAHHAFFPWNSRTYRATDLLERPHGPAAALFYTICRAGRPYTGLPAGVVSAGAEVLERDHFRSALRMVVHEPLVRQQFPQLSAVLSDIDFGRLTAASSVLLP